MRDSTGLRLPGFLEIQLEGGAMTVIHHAWAATEWKAVPMIQNIVLSSLAETVAQQSTRLENRFIS